MEDDDIAGLLSDEEDDGPQHDPGHVTLVVAQPPAEVPATTSTLQVRATAIGRAEPTVLGGNQRKAVWSLYKNVMSSVFDEVRQLVEQEGLEPSVATDIREVRPSQRILALCAPPRSSSQLPWQKWTVRMNDSGVLDHGLRSTHEPPSTSVGGGQRLIAPQHLTPAATAQGSERKRPAAPSGGSRIGQLRGNDMYSNSESSKPAKTMVRHPLQPSHTTCALRSARTTAARSPCAEEAQTQLGEARLVTNTFDTRTLPMPLLTAYTRDALPCARAGVTGYRVLASVRDAGHVYGHVCGHVCGHVHGHVCRHVCRHAVVIHSLDDCCEQISFTYRRPHLL